MLALDYTVDNDDSVILIKRQHETKCMCLFVCCVQERKYNIENILPVQYSFDFDLERLVVVLRCVYILPVYCTTHHIQQYKIVFRTTKKKKRKESNEKGNQKEKKRKYIFRSLYRSPADCSRVLTIQFEFPAFV